MPGAGTVPPGVGPAQPQVPPGGQGIEAEPQPGQPLGDDGGAGGAGHTPAQPQHKGQVQHDVEQRRKAQKDQRPHRVPHRPQQAGVVVVQEGAADARKDHQQVGAHEAAHGHRHLQQPEDGVDEQEHRQVERHGGAADHAQGEEDLPPHAVAVPPPIGDGHRHPASHGQAQQDGGEEGHQGIGRPHGGQGVGAHIPPHNEGIGDVVQLLQQVAGHHGQGKAQQRGGDGPFGQGPGVGLHGVCTSWLVGPGAAFPIIGQNPARRKGGTAKKDGPVRVRPFRCSGRQNGR